MRPRILLFFILLLLTGQIIAQVEIRNMFPTPNAAGLGTFGQIPVDLFTGQPQIEIPLYTFKSRDLSIPISLSYQSAGIKPSDRAGWVGLGWSLQAGGVITRIQNDLPDEWVNYSYANGSDISQVKNGFFYNYSVLGDANWLSSTYTSALSCALQQATVVTTCDPQHRKDYAPDEFAFNFLGMSGSLFMGQDGQWQIKSKAGLSFSVHVDIGPYWVVEPTSWPSVPAGSGIKSCIQDLIVTAADGTKYTFGGTPTSIEFARVGPGTGYYDTRDGGTVPTSWYLTKIVSVTGDEIDLNYTRDGYQIMNYPNGVAYTYYCPTCTPGASYHGGTGTQINDNLTILDGVTLSSITGANGSVQFNKSKANVLDFSLVNINAIPASTVSTFLAYGYEVFNGNMNSGYNIADAHSTFMKLDKIVVNGYGLSKSFSFNYTENTNNRLFLNSITTAAQDGSAMPAFAFTYNNIAGLANVPYETIGTDHWGYFNGINPLGNLYFVKSHGFSSVYNPTDPIFIYDENAYYPSAFDAAFNAQYTYAKSPQSGPMAYGVLTRIDYPTGGNTQFTWEPNTYGKYIDQSPVSGNPHIGVIDQGGNNTGPGLRIQQISSQANFNSPTVTKTYTYCRDFLNNNYINSGVLNSGLPLYVDTYASTGDFTYKVWSTNNRVPLHYTNGSPLTYTSVQEHMPDGSYKVYTYSNHDNGYLNKLPNQYFVLNYGNAIYTEFTSNSDELERGLLLNEATYKLGSNILDNKAYTYNSDANRFNNGVRRYMLENKFSLAGTIMNFQAPFGSNPAGSGPPVYTGFNFYAFMNYTHYPYLAGMTETRYDQNSANGLVTTITNTYDAYRNKKTEVITSSKGETVTSTFKYAADALTTTPALPTNEQSDMMAAHMVSQVLEKTSTRNSVEIEHVRNDYQTYTNINTFIVPVKAWNAFGGNALENAGEFTAYDTKGNVVTYKTRNGIPVSVLWDYNQACPTAKVENTTSQMTTQAIYYGWGGDLTTTASYSFTSTFPGTVAFSIYPGPLSGQNLTVNYTLTTPQGTYSGSPCIGTGTGCSPYITISYPNMPVGNYTASFTITSSNGTYPVLHCLGSYPKQQLVLTNEFFYQGFEQDDVGPSAITGSAHTGNRYYYSSGAPYTVPFTPPATHSSYLIQWWSWSQGKWLFHEQPYTANMAVPGVIDDVRVFPSDARMTTYTYYPLVGMTGEIDPRGITKTYEYDGLGRLTRVRDNDRNIVSEHCYNYAGQTAACAGVTTYFGNVQQQQVFTRNNCPAGSVSRNPVTYTVSANTYQSTLSQADADQQALNDVVTNGQDYANAHGDCTPIWYNLVQNGPWQKNDCQPGATGSSVSYTVPANTYSSYVNQMDADNQAIAAGQAYANAHGTCNASCSFTAQTGFSIVTSSINSSGGTASFYIVFFQTTGSAAWTSGVNVALINGGCRPSANRTVNMSWSGRNFVVTIGSNGVVNVRLTSGTAPTQGQAVNLSGGSYSL